MAIDETCPDCGGTEHQLLSPGLLKCVHVIHWTEQELVTEYVTVDDPGMFYNMGLRGTTSVPQQRWVDVERSRVCDNVYEVDTPMTSTQCQFGPGGKPCGAFAVGFCSDCQGPVCRRHGSFYDDRLLCDGCKAAVAAVNQQRATAERAAALAVQQEQARERRERDRAKEAADLAAVEAEKSAALARGESLDVSRAAQDYIMALLAKLGQMGYPGLDAYTPESTSRFRRAKPVPAYYLETVKGPKQYIRAEPYEPTVQLYVTLDGNLIATGPPARQWVTEEVALKLHYLALEHRATVPVPYGLRTLEGYNFLPALK